MASQNNSIVQLVHQNLSASRLDAMDTLTARHTQVQAVLSTLSLSFTSPESVPSVETVRNTLSAALELIRQAQDAAVLLD